MSSDKTKEVASDVLEGADTVSKEAKKYGKEGLSYIKDHPVKSLLFGTMIGLVIKRLFK